MVPVVTMSIMTDPGECRGTLGAIRGDNGDNGDDDGKVVARLAWISTLWIQAARPNVPKRAPAPRQP